MTHTESVPACLRSVKQWVCWRYEQRSDSGKPTKIPVTIGGHGASSTDPSDWYSYEDVCEASHKFDGIGFVFTAEDPYLGIDLDDCLAGPGELKRWAEPIMSELDGSYSEISPSGNGIKVICQAVNPLPSGRKVAIEDGWLEMYDRGRFFTVTGTVWDPDDPSDKQAEIEAITRRHFMSAELPKPVGQTTTRVVKTDKVERAARYLATMEPSISGSGGHDACFRAACKMVMGFDLDTETALSLLSNGFNARCTPPWSERELRHKVESADSQEGERGYLLTEQTSFESAPGVDLSGILGGTIAEIKKNKPEPAKFPTECLRPPGLIRDIIDYTLATSLYPQPEMALAGAISLVATITGRKLTDGYGTRTNVYVLGLAPSGSGKEQARRTNKEILLAAGGEAYIGPERIGSSAGLVGSVADQPSILFQLDEIGRLLATLKNPGKAAHLYNIATVLMALYSSSDSVWIGDAYADAKKIRKIDQPHAVMYGTSVAESFWGSLNAENVSDGLLGRIMAFESAAGYVDPQTPESITLPDSIVERVRWWLRFEPGGDLSSVHPQPKEANYTPAAKERFDGHMRAIAARRKQDDPQVAAIWSRSAGKAGKLALIFAASRFTGGDSLMQVEFQDVDLAIALSNYLTRRTLEQVADHVSDNEQESRNKRILRMLDTPMTRSQLTRKTQWLKQRERQEILIDLIEAGLVESIETDTGGRPLVVFQRA